MDPPSPKELQLLGEFRKSEIAKRALSLGDQGKGGPEADHETFFLLKWLRARGGDLEKAKEMLEKNLKWKEEFGFRNVAEEEREEASKMFPFARCGADRDGNLVTVMPCGRWRNLEAIQTQGVKATLRKYILASTALLQALEENERKLGKCGLQIIEVVDLEGFSYWDLTSAPFLQLVAESEKILEANFPEVMKKVIVINAPMVFWLLYKMLKGLLPEGTFAKVALFSKGEDWKGYVKREIPEALEKVPERWGGTLRGSDPFCSENENVWIGGPLNPSFFSS